MVKYQITKEEYDALSPELKAEYKESGDAYKLDVSGIDAKAQDKLDGERSKRRDAEKAQKTAEDALEAFKDGDDRPQLIAAHDKALKKEKDRADAAEAKFTAKVRTDTLGNTATDLANSLSKNSAKLLMPHINSRLDVDMTDPANPKVIVLDAAGKPTDKKVDDLRAEFVANKDFSAIITGSQATGGAASKQSDSGRSGLPTGGAAPKPVDLSKLSGADLAAQITERRRARGLEVAE